MARERTVDTHPEDLAPSPETGSPPSRPPFGDVSRHDEMCRGKTAARTEQSAEQPGRDPEWRVRNDAERPPRQQEIDGVDLHHLDRTFGEASPELLCATGMKFEGNDASAGGDQRHGQRAGTGTDVEDEVTGENPCPGDEAPGPVVSELVKSPVRPPVGGHGAPSPWS